MDTPTPTPKVSLKPRAARTESKALVEEIADNQPVSASLSTTATTRAWKKEPEWESRDLFVGLSCRKTTNPYTAWSLLALALDLSRERVQFDMVVDSHSLRHARNIIASRFLASDAKTLLLVDDDMILPVGRENLFRSTGHLPASYPSGLTQVHIAHRFMAHGRDIVGATYFSRRDDGLAVTAISREPDFIRAAVVGQDRLFETEWTGAGCVSISRRTLESIKSRFPELAVPGEPGVWDFFRPDESGSFIEEHAFFERASQCGIKAYTDTMVQCLHVGDKSFGLHTARTNRVI